MRKGPGKKNVMAAAPLESSSTTPPDVKSIDSTRSPGDPMEDNDPHSTRKRPRLDSGSGIRENWSSDKTDPARMSDQASDAPAATERETLASTRPASRVTINVKSPTTTTAPADDMASVSAVPEDPPAAQPDPTGPSQTAEDVGTHASKAISLSSSPAQSPEIEVAELEDMDQDPNTSNWKPLGEALGDGDVVQLQDQPPLTETFPKLRPDHDIRDNLEEICTIIEKGKGAETLIVPGSIRFHLIEQSRRASTQRDCFSGGKGLARRRCDQSGPVDLRGLGGGS